MSEEKKHPLEKADWGLMQITVYRNCVVSRLVGGFSVFSQKVVRPEQVDEIIDNHEKGGLFPNDGLVAVDDKFKEKQEQWRKQRFGD